MAIPTLLKSFGSTDRLSRASLKIAPLDKDPTKHNSVNSFPVLLPPQVKVPTVKEEIKELNNLVMIFEGPIPRGIKAYLGEPDKHVSRWFLLDSPAAFFSILLTYVSTLTILHRLMRTRKPFVLRKLLIVYNAFQVFYSSYICKEIFVSAVLADYKLACAPCNSNTKIGLRMAKAFWLFYISKVIDLTDTVFFVLRKKHKQITFLHLYHHSTMIFNWYLGVLYSPGGQVMPLLRPRLGVLFNSFVHVIMYLYYMLSAIGPWMQKYLWWKRYLTQIQLIQFVAVISHLAVGLYNKCRAPFWLNWFTIIYLCTLLVLFGNFYYNAYKLKIAKPIDRNSMDFLAAGDFKHE